MVNVLISTDSRYGVNRKVIRKAVEETFVKNKMPYSKVEVSVAVVGRRKMGELGELYLKDDKHHVVLAFALEDVIDDQKGGFINAPDAVLRLGDVVLCWPDVLEEASVKDIFVDEEVYFLISHATEHLLGKHHE